MTEKFTWGTPGIVLSLALALLVSACATVPEEAGFDGVRDTVSERAGLEVQWRHQSVEDASVDEAVLAMLEKPLTVEHAVQIALLNNRRLQATYERLGVAQGELVQAGLLRNPLFHAGVGFTAHGLDLDFSVAQSFLEIFLIPLRTRVANERLEEVRLEVTGEVLSMAWQVKMAFLDQQAREQAFASERDKFEASEATMLLAKELHGAGNISDQAFTRERIQYEQARLDLARAEVTSRAGHEELGALMGLWGERARWSLEGVLPAVPEAPIDTTSLERRALQQSLDLVLAKQRIAVELSRMGVTNFESLLPEFELGGEAIREDGEWEIGPTIGLEIPLFDHGQGARRVNQARVRKLWNDFTATAVELRASARIAALRLSATRAQALHARDVLVPLRRQYLQQTLMMYNGMFIGGFELVSARMELIDTQRMALTALRDYWRARANVELLLQGRMIPMGAGMNEMEATPSGGASSKGGGH